MRQAGRYLPEYQKIRAEAGSFLNLCYTPDLAVEVALQPIHRYGFDGAILFSDILVIPDALGRNVEFSSREGPVLTPLRQRTELDQLEAEKVTEALQPVYEAVRQLAVALPETVTLIGFAGAPWTVAVYMVEGRGGGYFSNILNWAQKEPDSFRQLIQVLTDATVLHLSAQIEAGAEVVQLFDSWAGIAARKSKPNKQLFNLWCLEPAREIVMRLGEMHPGVPVIAFPREAGWRLEEYARGTEATAVSLDTAVPLDWAAKTLPSRTVLQGNLDPIVLSEGGDDLQAQAQRIIEALRDRAHVFNLGHGIRKDTNPEHVTELVEAVRGTP